jgi:hypothetical protein
MINARIADKDRELQLLRQRDELNNDALAALSERLMELEAQFRNSKRLGNKNQEITRFAKSG